MKNLVTIIMTMLLTASTCWAANFESGGIKFNTLSESGKTVEVTYGVEYKGDVTIPASVEYKGKKWTVTAIGDNAFANNTEITGVSIPNTVTTIGERAFVICPGLTSIVIPNSVTTIGNMAFMECLGLKSVKFGKAVTDIGESAFEYCEGLTEVVIPDNVVNIGSYAFTYCSNLKSITIGRSVNNIGFNDFFGCERLRRVNMLSTSPPKVSDYAFIGLNNVVTVSVPYGYLNAYKTADVWKDFSKFESIIKDGDLYFSVADDATNTVHLVAKPTGKYVGTVNVPNTITYMDRKWTVTKIDENAFFNCPDLVNIEVESNNSFYTSVEGALYDKAVETLRLCPAGKVWISIPHTVSVINDLAFVGCRKLMHINALGETPPSAVDNLFSDSTYENATLFFETNKISKNYKDIAPWNKFSNVERNGGFTANGIEYNIIGKGKLAVTSGPEYVGDILIPDTVEYNNKTYTVTEIGEYAFELSTRMNSITLPNTITHIGEGAFIGCENLKRIEIPNSVESIDKIAFADCIGLTNILIPNSVKSIGDLAFDHCTGLVEATIGSETTNIGEFAFEKCTSLRIVNILATLPPSASDFAFARIGSDVSLVVPYGSVETYKNSMGWNHFKDVKGHTDFIKSGELYFAVVNEKEKTLKLIAHPEKSYTGEVNVPSSISYMGETWTVSSVSVNTFRNCSELTSIEFEE